MNPSLRCLAVFAGVALLTAGASPMSGQTSSGHGRILWDSYGVPHIYSKTESGVFFGFGYAQAQSHGNLLLHLYGESRGRGAEYFGREFLASDQWVVTNSVYERGAEWYKLQTPAFRADVDAFAAGINEYARRHPEAIDPAIKVVLPITGVDVIAHAERLTNFSYVASQARVTGVGGVSGGSNAWAIAPSKSASGHTLLLANPHLPWAPSSLTYYEAQLEGPDIHMYGATQVGLPVLRFCFNNDLGFTNTVNQVIGDTSYKLTLAEGGYLYDGKVLPFKTEQRTIKVKDAPDEVISVRTTLQGPVFTKPNGDTIALKVAGLDRPGMLQEYWDMGKAHNFAEFQAALQRVQVPTFNILYGDRAGHILYLYNGIVPEHSTGDWKYWRADVPGDTSATAWSKIHPYEDLPKVIDPAAGFVQNTNDPPWIASGVHTLAPGSFPPYMAPLTGITLRSEQSVDFLLSKPKLTYDDFTTLKFSNRALLADRILPELFAAAEPSTDPDVQAAVQVLKSWDHVFNPESRGALLFEQWCARFLGPAFLSEANYARPFSLDDPLHTPSGLKDPAAAVRMLAEAATATRRMFGSLDRPYGEVTKFRAGNISVPAGSGSGSIGIFPSMIFGKPDKDGVRDATSGETWISMVEFTTPLKAQGLMAYGNSTQPGTKHRSDQVALLGQRKLRTLWMTEPVIQQHLEEKTEF